MPAAQFKIGWMYAKGLGVPQDYKTAVKWYKLAAEQDYGVILAADGLSVDHTATSLERENNNK